MALQTSGIRTETVKNLWLDAGAVYVNLEETDERLLGATREGATFLVEQEVREIAMDGVRGPLKGARRVINEHARITASILEMATANMQLAMFGTTVSLESAGDYETITRDIAYETESGYIKNIALVGDIQGSAVPMIIVIKNALADGNFEFSTTDQEEPAVEVQFTAHFDPANLTQSPWEIRSPVNRSLESV